MKHLRFKQSKSALFWFFSFLLFTTTAATGQVVIQRCDLRTGWSGDQAITIDSDDKKEGGASLKTEAQAGTTDWFKKSFSSTQTGIDETGYLTFWLYVSDASLLEGGAVEITSSGAQDDMSTSWSFDKNNMSTGWNEMQLQINAGTIANGGVNLDSVNFIRIHQNLSAPVTAKLDFVRFTPNLGTPVWPVLHEDKVDNSTLDGKVMFGYQGWFNHPEDGAGLGWIHWGDLYEPIKLSCDLFPDMREFGADEKYDSHFTYPDGSAVEVFSSFNKHTTIRHMKWVRDYNLDGVFIQRFISSAADASKMAHKDTVTVNVMRGCEKYGGVYAIMYDGVANKVEEMKADWIHLVDDIGVTESDRYLHHRGLPLVSLWGYTVRDDATYDQLEEMVEFFTNNPDPKYRASVKLGVAHNWYDQSEFYESFKKAEVISPWFSGNTDYDRGQAWCDQNNVDFLPVVHPGFSWHNLSLDYEDHPGSGDLNRTPRDKGNFLWDEVNEVLSVSAKSIYIAMFDEIDEGTAMFKCAETINDVPVERDWVTLDIDGYDLPSDWYLRLASLTSNVVRGYEDNKSSLDNLPEPPEGRMTIRIRDAKNNGNDGAMEFIFPDFPDASVIEISIDGGLTWEHSTPDNTGTFTISDLEPKEYSVFVRHGAGADPVNMGRVLISNVFEGPAEKASTPFPENGATNVSLNSVLGWKAGDLTVSNVIYFGTSETPDSITYQSSEAYNIGSLEPETTYYWKINSRNAKGTTEGDLWSFTTGDGSAPTDIAVLDYCDEVTGWNSHNSVSLDSENKKEGFASLRSEGTGTVWFNKKFEEPVNSFCDETGYLDIYIYVSDVSKFDGGGQLEIGSAGSPDSYEYNWLIADLNLVDGWNELHLPIASASVMDTPDLSAINWFRLYQFVSGPIETRIDFIRFTELSTTPLGAPANLSVTVGSDIVSLDWDDNAESTFAGYNLYRSETSGVGFEKLNTDLIEVSEYNDIDVVTGTTYFYKVSAVDTLGYEGHISEEVSALPKDTEKPAAPANLVAVPGNEEVTLDWDDNTEDDLAGYEVYRTSTPGSDYWNVRTVTESTFTDRFLTNGKSYYYIITAIDDSQNESEPSEEVEAIPGAVSVEQLSLLKDFKLYPNPASDEATAKITLTKLSAISVSIFDLAGSELHSFINNQEWAAGEHTLYIPLYNFDSGMYILKCTVNGQSKSKLLEIE